MTTGHAQDAEQPETGITPGDKGAFRSPPAPLRIASEVNEYPMKVISPSLTP